jgi:hypothetical protein
MYANADCRRASAAATCSITVSRPTIACAAASRAARFSAETHSCARPMRFIVMSSAFVLNRLRPVAGRLSTPSVNIGSGCWPAARATCEALMALARADCVICERWTASSTACSRLSGAATAPSAGSQAAAMTAARRMGVDMGHSEDGRKAAGERTRRASTGRSTEQVRPGV